MLTLREVESFCYSRVGKKREKIQPLSGNSLARSFVPVALCSWKLDIEIKCVALA
jgi:hypothetical protein